MIGWAFYIIVRSSMKFFYERRDIKGVMFSSLHGLFRLWEQRSLYTNQQIQQYKGLATNFGKAWKVLGWKVSPWVHWLVRHSSYLANLHRNFLYLVPTRANFGYLVCFLMTISNQHSVSLGKWVAVLNEWWGTSWIPRRPFQISIRCHWVNGGLC